MNQNKYSIESDQLEPPGTIAIIGAGPIGIEAALYARSLGYHVTVFEAANVGQRLANDPNSLLTEPFRRCSSPLGIAALATQHPGKLMPLPDSTLQHREYLEHYLLPLSQSDLLVDSLRLHCRVTDIDFEPWEASENETDGDILPQDFIVTTECESGKESSSFECLIDASGSALRGLYPSSQYDPKTATHPDLASGVPYLLRIGAASSPDCSYLEGLEQIRRLFSILFDRASLDLYRNARY